MTGQQLKNSILQEAIEGRLVPQNPNDEPASVLLERIRAEKARLVKEKKIILSKPEKNCICTPTCEYDLPENWVWCNLNDICRVFGRIGFRGYTKNDLRNRMIEGAISISPSNMKENSMDYTNCTYISMEKYEESPEIKINNGDILIVKTGSSYGKTTLVENLPWIATINPQIAVLKNISINKKYLLYFLQSPYAKDKYKEYVLGTSIPTFSQLNLISTSIPLPPLAEQQRIVEKIESLLPKVEAYGKAQEELVKLNEALPEQLKKSILQEAIEGRLVPQDPNDEPASVLLERIRAEKARLVKEKKIKKSVLKEIIVTKEEKIFDIPNSWEWCKIDTIFQHASGKQLKSGDTDGALYKYITTSNLYWGRFVLDGLKSMYFNDAELDRCTAKKGDLLVCEGGDVGRSAIWPYDYNICLQNHVHKLRPYVNGYTQYVFYVFWYYKNTGLIGGKGIGIKGLSASALKDISIPLPPLAEQQRIVEKIESLLPIIEKLKIRK